MEMNDIFTKESMILVTFSFKSCYLTLNFSAKYYLPLQWSVQRNDYFSVITAKKNDYFAVISAKK